MTLSLVVQEHGTAAELLRQAATEEKAGRISHEAKLRVQRALLSVGGVDSARRELAAALVTADALARVADEAGCADGGDGSGSANTKHWSQRLTLRFDSAFHKVHSPKFSVVVNGKIFRSSCEFKDFVELRNALEPLEFDTPAFPRAHALEFAEGATEMAMSPVQKLMETLGQEKLVVHLDFLPDKVHVRRKDMLEVWLQALVSNSERLSDEKRHVFKAWLAGGADSSEKYSFTGPHVRSRLSNAFGTAFGASPAGANASPEISAAAVAVGAVEEVGSGQGLLIKHNQAMVKETEPPAPEAKSRRGADHAGDLKACLNAAALRRRKAFNVPSEREGHPSNPASVRPWWRGGGAVKLRPGQSF